MHNPEGQRGGVQKQTTHQETKNKTEQCDAKACRSGISTSPTPCWESLRQKHPNKSKQHCLAKIGNMQAVQTFNQQLFPRILPFRCTCRVLLFVKAASFFAKKVTAAISCGAVNTLAFWTPRSFLWMAPIGFRLVTTLDFWTPRSGPPQRASDAVVALGDQEV